MGRAGSVLKSVGCSVTALALVAFATVQPAEARLRGGTSVVMVPKVKKANWTTNTAPLPRSLPDKLSISQADLFDISCPSSGSCVAVGEVYGADTNSYPLIETYSGGSWKASIAQVPANGTSAGPGGFGQLMSVSCPAAGVCAAVGQYSNSGSAEYVPLLESLSDGKWTAKEGQLPAGYDLGVFMYSVSCAVAGACVAVGDGNGATPGTPGFAYVLGSGTWTLQPELPLPKDFDTNLNLASVSCADATDCVAVGSYSTPWPSTSSLGLIYTYTSGKWSIEKAPLPTNASAVQGYIPLGLQSVDCVEATECVGGGTYEDTNGNLDPLFVTLESGQWTPDEGPSLEGIESPSDSAVTGISCLSIDSCVADGSAGTLKGASQISGVLMKLTSSGWTAFASNLPSLDQNGFQDTSPEVFGISCFGGNLCRTAGNSGNHPLIGTLRAP